MRRGLAWLALALALPAAAAAQNYRYPLGGCRSGCATVSAHYDLDRGAGLRDWSCGTHTYNNHRGTDIAIYGRFTAQDQGRNIVAGAEGTVIASSDGEFDRCESGTCAGGSGFGNYVALRHADGKVTYYCHMRRGSVRVRNGERVTCGQMLGQVGSSGFSTGPHLHFEVRVNNVADDPYGARPGCGGETSYWVGQEAYRSLPSEACATTAPPPPPPPPPPPCDRRVAPFGWNCAGPLPGMTCTNVNEPADPHAWSDNHVCAERDLGLRWSHAGAIPGMQCTAVTEGSEPAAHGWDNNFLCAPLLSPYALSWSAAGPLAGRTCMAWSEPADPHAWSDNHLCWTAARYESDPLAFAIVNAHTHDRDTSTDLDGDGRADLCARGVAGLRCWLARAEGWVDSPFALPLSDAQGWADPSNYLTIRYGDLNGDGRADLCARADAGIRCWHSTAEGFGPTLTGPELSDAAGWALPQYFSTLRLVDVTGDGRADLCVRGPEGVRCHPSLGDGFGPAIEGPALSDADGWSDPLRYGSMRFGDLNADGRADLCARGADGVLCWTSRGDGFDPPRTGPAWGDAFGWRAPQHALSLRLLDLDGDGRDDLCARGADGVVCARSVGEGFAPPRPTGQLMAATWDAPAHAFTLMAADVNGDRRDDLCARGDQRVVCLLATAGGTFDAESVGPAWSDTDGWLHHPHNSTLQLADTDGDGRADLCARAAAGVHCARALGVFGQPVFAPSVLGPALANASGWGEAPYYTTVRVAGPRRARGELTGPRDDAGVPVARDAGAEAQDAGGDAMDAGELALTEYTGGCGCRTGGAPRGGVGAVLGTLAMLGYARRRRRRASR